MRKQSSILLAVSVFANVALANVPTVDLDTPLNCTVTQSNDQNIKVGAITSEKISVRAIGQKGAIAFVGGAIDFYGPLVTYDVWAPGSGMVALATNPTLPGEVKSSVFVSTEEGKLVLDIQVFQMARVFERASGAQAFITKDPPSVYRLSCEP